MKILDYIPINLQLWGSGHKAKWKLASIQNSTHNNEEHISGSELTNALFGVQACLTKPQRLGSSFQSHFSSGTYMTNSLFGVQLASNRTGVRGASLAHIQIAGHTNTHESTGLTLQIGNYNTSRALFGIAGPHVRTRGTNSTGYVLFASGVADYFDVPYLEEPIEWIREDIPNFITGLF